ncbi:endonuclease/exonuclease/phosphatase family protein [Chloroflexota bacterium]
MQKIKQKNNLVLGLILIAGLLILLQGCALFSGADGSDLFGPPDTIILDGRFVEWSHREPVYTDPAEDNTGESVDFTSLYLDNDQDYLYMDIALNIETNIQNGSDLILYIDTDNDPGSGEEFNGLGADLVYELGNRRGRLYKDGIKTGLEHDFIGLITMPTVTSDEFEIGIARTMPLGGARLFTSNEIKIAFAHNIEAGDIIPDAGSTIAYTFTEKETSPPTIITLEKEKSSHLRIVSWNTLDDGLLKKARTEQFYNILRAVDADIINLQEMYVTKAEDIQAQMEEWFPETEWFVDKYGDLITISRYPIVEPEEGSFPLTTGASPVLIQLSKDQQLLIINSHFRCCDQDDLRQREIDEVMSLIRDSQSVGDRIDLPAETPIIILGDMNLVGYAQQVKTLLYGDIINEVKYGPDYKPDWDDTPLTDLLSRHTENLLTFTWRDDKTSFSPGRLDYFVYTDSVLKVAKHYILDTAELPDETLAEYGLNADDSVTATDHLTLVVDFVIK